MMKRVMIALCIGCCFIFGCAPQQKTTTDAEVVLGRIPAIAESEAFGEQAVPAQMPGQSQSQQNTESAKKIGEFFKLLPPVTITKTDIRPQPDSSPKPEDKTRIAQLESARSVPPKTPQVVQTDKTAQQHAFKKEDPAQGVKLNFENADIRDVARAVSEITHKSFIVDKGVEGVVTLYSDKALLPDQVFELFKSVLELNKLALIQIGDFYKIVKSEDAQKRYLTVESGTLPAAEDRLVTQIIKLKYVNAKVVKNALKSLTSSEQNIIVPETIEGNTLIITDLASNVRKLLEIIQEIDVIQYANRYVEVFPIKYADLKDLINELNQVLAIEPLAQTATPLTQPAQPTQQQAPGVQGEVQQPASPIVPPGTRTNLYAIKRLNALLVSTNYPEVISLVRKWIDILDRPPVGEISQETAPNTPTNYIYAVKYGKAEELAPKLAEIYGQGIQQVQPVQPGQQPQQQQPQQQQQQVLQNPAAGSAPIFIPDSGTNSIIIRATPTQYAQINTLLEKLDRRPLQVLIDVIIAEVSLTDSDVFGVQGMLKGQNQVTIGSETDSLNATATTTFAGIEGGDGFSYVMNTPARFLLQLKALASESRVKVLSDPHILVQNNKAAKINVGDSIPITTVKGTGDNAQQNVEYKETGIILTVTPQINLEGDVVMEILQEVSTAGTKATGDVAPPINRTSASTFLVTRDGHPLIIGGLINTRDSKTIQGVPILKDIPLLGRLFRYNEKQSGRKELVILVVPRIIKTPEDGWNLTDDVLSRQLKRLEQLFNREESEPEKIRQFFKQQFSPEE